MSIRIKLLTPALLAISLAGCGAFPELDGQPVTAIRAADLRQNQAPVWTLDFADPGLRAMLAQADVGGLDVLTARARARAADVSLRQTAAGRLPSLGASGGVSGDVTGSRTPSSTNVGLSTSWDADLSGRLEAAIRAAALEKGAVGADLVAARRTVAREIVTTWVGLAEAQSRAARAEDRARLAERALTLQSARAAGGETTTGDISTRTRRLIEARTQAAEAAGQIAVAQARLRALGATSLPGQVNLRARNRPAVPAQTDLAGLDNRPDVCAAWARFHAADASRAEALRASRPRVAVSGSLAAAARTLAGLAAGNALAISQSVSVEGSVFDGGQSRARVDQARIGQAQAEITWLQTRARAEVALLEAVVERHGAEAQLAAALKGYEATAAERNRVRLRHQGGISDGLELADAEGALADAQAEVDTARARAFRAAATWAEAQGVPGLCPAPVRPSAAG